MNINSTFEKLAENGIVRITGNKDVVLTSAFLNEAEAQEEVDVPDFPLSDSMSSKYSDIVSYFSILKEWTDFSAEDRLQIAAIIGQLDGRVKETNGVPKPCFPIAGSDVPLFIRAFDPAVFYFWRNNCDPCESMYTELEEILKNKSNLAMFAVYGPPWSVSLKEEFDVGGAPTLLFAAGGSIESRLLGLQYQESIKKELSAIQA